MSDQDTAANDGTSHVPWTSSSNSMHSFVTFDPTNKALIGRLIKNKIFGILTLGIYRFWGKTQLRRLLWQAVKIGRDRLEYHGTAKELFIGFLIAMVVLSILFTVGGILMQFLTFGNPLMIAVQQYLNLALLYGFWQFARYRLWRYRLSRTSLRTIRFFLKGKALTYTWICLLWTGATILTFGWLYPYLRAARIKYQMNNVCFGDQRFSYKGQVGAFYRIYWPVILFWQISSAAMLGYMGYLSGFDYSILFNSGIARNIQPPSFTAFGVFAVAVIAQFVMIVYARAAEFRYVTSSVLFAGACFKSGLNFKALLAIFGILALIGIATFAVIAGMIAAAIPENGSQIDPTTLVLPYLLIFFIVFFVLDIIKFLFFFVPLVKAVSRSLSTDNAKIFDEVAASSEQSPVYGEGLADAMDVGAF